MIFPCNGEHHHKKATRKRRRTTRTTPPRCAFRISNSQRKRNPRAAPRHQPNSLERRVLTAQDAQRLRIHPRLDRAECRTRLPTSDRAISIAALSTSSSCATASTIPEPSGSVPPTPPGRHRIAATVGSAARAPARTGDACRRCSPGEVLARRGGDRRPRPIPGRHRVQVHLHLGQPFGTEAVLGVTDVQHEHLDVAIQHRHESAPRSGSLAKLYPRRQTSGVEHAAWLSCDRICWVADLKRSQPRSRPGP